MILRFLCVMVAVTESLRAGNQDFALRSQTLCAELTIPLKPVVAACGADRVASFGGKFVTVADLHVSQHVNHFDRCFCCICCIHFEV